MASVWITYAWDDNKDQQVDYIAQELEAAGLTVKLDRWNLKSGSHLWEQISEFIESPAQCDAWILIATQNSLSSKPCKEEYAIALNRALDKRGNAFPVMALFTGTYNDTLLPAGLKIRLNVSLRDPDWKERIVAAAEGRDHLATREKISPYFLQVHQKQAGQGYVIEVRPRAGTWNPFVAAIPEHEQNSVRMTLVHTGPPGHPSSPGVIIGGGDGNQNGLYFHSVQGEATPTMSGYIHCAELPSTILFGSMGQGHTLNRHVFRPNYGANWPAFMRA